MKSVHTLSLIRCFLIATLLFPVSTFAQEVNESTPSADREGTGPAVSLRPYDQPDGSRFEASVEAEETHEFIVVIGNYGEEPIDLRAYVADPVPSINGGLLLPDSEYEKTGNSTWINFPTEEFTLQPGEEIQRSMVVNVPSGTEPGQYVSGIALETVNPVQEVGNLNQYFRRVVAIYITVPGDLYTDFEFGEPSVQYRQNRPFLVIPVTNTGRVRIDLSGNVTLFDAEGATLSQVPTTLAPIYMGQVVDIYVPLATPPEEGDYTVSAEFTDTNTETKVSLDQVAFVAEAPPTQDANVPLAVENVEIVANDEPIVFANVSVTVVSNQSSLPSTRLTLSVFHDGEHVEDFVLAENLRLDVGVSTVVSQRYLPATNWESGTYTFSLKLESTESGSSSVLLESPDVATLEVP